MAREAYRSLYGDLTKLKDSSLLSDPASGAADDPELFQLLLAASAWVDRYCDRHFYPRVQTLEFDGTDQAELFIPDLAVITSLKEDTDENLSFETTWATTDFWLEPYNAEPTEHWGHPYTLLTVRARGSKATFTKGQQRFQIAGRWGYREFTELSGSLVAVDSPLSATATTMNVTLGTDFAIGQTVLVESEQMLITNIAANALTVRRALNGTTGATHALNTAISILRWPLGIERATLITAARLWTRAPDFEPFYVDADVDTDVRLLLNSYLRLPV
jgi:hypothetical protein